MIHHVPPAPDQAETRIALRNISAARRILEEVVTSSESFDYPKAKAGLDQLQHLIRELGREETRLRAVPQTNNSSDDAKVVPFSFGV